MGRCFFKRINCSSGNWNSGIDSRALMCGPKNSFVSWTAWPNGRKPEYHCLSGVFFGDSTEIAEKEGKETEGAPAALRVHFFTTSVWSIRNCTICSEIESWLCCLSTGLDLYVCWWPLGGCNADFIVAVFAVVCVLMALSALPLADVFAALGAADCWGVSDLLYFPPVSGSALKFCFPTGFFPVLIFASGREISSCLKSFIFRVIQYFSLCLCSHRQLLQIISTGITLSGSVPSF